MTLPYGGTVLEHFRRPRNRRELAAPTVARDGYNPLCGDRVRIELMVENAVIAEAAFTANACAICTASASLLTERVRGREIHEALSLSDSDVIAALETEVPAGRSACATLPAKALREALSDLRQLA
jgi:nitrogen fixation NifU-like protein